MFVCFCVSSVFFSHLHSCCFLVLVLCCSSGCLLCMLCFLHELFPLIFLFASTTHMQKVFRTSFFLNCFKVLKIGKYYRKNALTKEIQTLKKYKVQTPVNFELGQPALKATYMSVTRQNRISLVS